MLGYTETKAAVQRRLRRVEGQVEKIVEASAAIARLVRS